MLAVVTGAHGIGGDVRCKCFTDDLGTFPAVSAGGRMLRVRSVRGGGREAIVRFEGIGDRTAAEALRGMELSVAREDLPPLEPGEYYHADLLGLPAVSDAGDELGTVVSVDNYGAGDVIEVERPDGRRFMVPMSPAAVPEWDDLRLVITTAFADQ